MTGNVASGASYVGRGFGLWRTRPRLMLLGLVPALIVLLVVLGALLVLLLSVGHLVAWATPVADDWSEGLRGVTRAGLAILVVVAAVLVAMSTFTGLTLMVGDPFYEKIWHETEVMLGGHVPESELGFLASARDAGVLMLVGLLSSVVVILSGVLPVVGPLVGVSLGVVLSGRLLARELLSRPLEARGYDRHAQKVLLAGHRRSLLGFGVATQLCFLVPFGGIVAMPAAVAGATMLARDVLPR